VCLKFILKIKGPYHKDLLHSMWNSAQRRVTAWMGGEFGGRMDTCMCVAQSFRCPPETVTTVFIGYTPTQNKKLKINQSNYYAVHVKKIKGLSTLNETIRYLLAFILKKRLKKYPEDVCSRTLTCVACTIEHAETT